MLILTFRDLGVFSNLLKKTKECIYLELNFGELPYDHLFHEFMIENMTTIFLLKIKSRSLFG